LTPPICHKKRAKEQNCGYSIIWRAIKKLAEHITVRNRKNSGEQEMYIFHFILSQQNLNASNELPSLKAYAKPLTALQ